MFSLVKSVITRLNKQLVKSAGAEASGDLQSIAAELRTANERLELTQTATGLTSWEWNFATDEMVWTAGRPNLKVLGNQPTLKYADVMAGVHPDDRKATRDAAYKARETNTPFSQEFRVQIPDGSVRWILSRGKVFHDRSGRPERMLGVNMDITDQKQAEANLKAERERFTSIFEQTAVGVAYVPRQGKFRMVNPKFCNMFGYSREELLEMKVVDLVHPDERGRAEKSRDDFLAGGAHDYTAERRYVRKDGTSFFGEVNVSQILKPEEQPLAVLIITDISARVAAEQEVRLATVKLQRAVEQAEAANQAKSHFLANVSHEIRTPLTSIIGFAELLQRTPISDEKMSRYKDGIIRNSRLLNRLIEDILDLSKIEADRLDLEYAEASLQAVVEDVRILLCTKSADDRVELRVSYDEKVPQFISTDPGRLRQILTNVIGNAIKFTPKGLVDVIVTTRAHADSQNGHLVFAIRDNGIGMNAEQQSRLFQPFSQADASTTRLYGGTGLGLALSKRLATLFGGDLNLTRSAPGGGSTFEVVLPLLPVTPSPDLKPDWSGVLRRGVSSRQDISGVKILVVEDSPDSQVFLSQCLSNHGAGVEVASDGREAIDKAMRGHFDLIFMDVHMPVMDGLEATTELRRLGFKGPIVALTALAFVHEKEKTLSAGCNGHVTKPISSDDLVAAVAEYLP